MKRSHIVGIAFAVYLFFLVIGGTVCYVLHTHQEAEREAMPSYAAPPGQQEEMKKTSKAQEDSSRRESERKEAEHEKQIDALKATMHEKVIDGVTYYTHDYDDAPTPGVYLRPFVAVDGYGNAVIKHDIYYYYTLDDPARTDWIFGDHLDITADGVTMTELLDTKKLHKKLAQNVEYLSEHYVLNADAEVVQALRNVGNAAAASIRYYKLGGKERCHELSAEERRRIHDMVALYDLLKEDE